MTIIAAFAATIVATAIPPVVLIETAAVQADDLHLAAVHQRADAAAARQEADQLSQAAVTASALAVQAANTKAATIGKIKGNETYS